MNVFVFHESSRFDIFKRSKWIAKLLNSRKRAGILVGALGTGKNAKSSTVETP